MVEAQVDLWEEPADARCITTNGTIKANGHLVMGAGTAGQAQIRYPMFPEIAGSMVGRLGNNVHHVWVPRKIGKGEDKFFIFPVKHDVWEDADLVLIERSARELMKSLEFFSSYKKVLLPRPGCGRGRLTWDQVRPVIEPILDDRVWVIWQ